MRRVLGLVVLGLVVTGCAQSENTLDDTLPTIAPVATTTTTTTTPPIPITAAATAVVTPAPITAPPAPVTTQAPAPTPAPATAATTAAPRATTTAAPGTTATTAAPTTTSLLAPTLTPLVCSAAALDAADPQRTHAEPSCLSGWAVEAISAEEARIFAAGADGWTLAGTETLDCPAPLVALGMPVAVAEQFAAATCDQPAGPNVIRPDDRGVAVRGLQVALVALGYELETDGIYGPRTEAAVRHFQSASGLQVDGLAGPNTQAALFSAAAPTTPATTTTVAATTTAPATPGLRACTAAALDAAEPGRTHAAPTCRAGWAVESAPCSAEPCPTAVPVFSATADGWESAGTVALDCPGELVELGMPVAVAETFTASACDQPPGPTVIRPGDQGPAVRGIQVALVSLGSDIEIDGTYGPGTEAAVREFQTVAGLEVDGLAGPATQEALFAAT